jgi:hypothetical protein
VVCLLVDSEDAQSWAVYGMELVTVPLREDAGCELAEQSVERSESSSCIRLFLPDCMAITATGYSAERLGAKRIDGLNATRGVSLKESLEVEMN